MADKDSANQVCGHAIKKRRVAADMTQADLAEILGIDQRTLSDIENGRRKTPLDIGTAGLLAREFDCGAKEFTADPAAYLETHIAIIFAAAEEDWQRQYRVALEHQVRNSIFTFYAFYPETDFNWEEHSGHRDRVLRDKPYYAAVIVLMPICTPEQFRELMQFAVKFKKPVIVVDKNPPVGAHEMPGNVRCVSFDDRVGGRRAGEEVLALIRKRKKENMDSQALVVTGYIKDPRSAKEARCTSFKRVLEADGIRTPVIPYGDFTEANATDITSNCLKQGLKDNKPYVAVFATSGPMTKGVVAAVSEVYEEKGRGSPPFVVGYDEPEGTRSGAIVGTVVQDVEELAKATIDSLRLLWRGRPAERIPPLKPGWNGAEL